MTAVLSFLSAAKTDTTTSGNPAVQLIFFVLIGVVFYFLLIRPQQRRARAQRELLSAIEVGDEVLTSSGMFGRITEIEDDEIVLEVAPGLNLRFVRGAIARRLTEDEPDAEEEEADEPS
jgi:preprotein translocase subunit YajC